MNTWVHLAVVLSNSSEAEVYINGQKLSGSYFHTGWDKSVIENILDEEFIIGGEFINSDIVWPGRHHWKGVIDDIYIHNRALSEAEIKQLNVVPIPPTLLLLGTGLAGLMVFRRRFRR